MGRMKQRHQGFQTLLGTVNRFMYDAYDILIEHKVILTVDTDANMCKSLLLEGCQLTVPLQACEMIQVINLYSWFIKTKQFRMSMMEFVKYNLLQNFALFVFIVRCACWHERPRPNKTYVHQHSTFLEKRLLHLRMRHLFYSYSICLRGLKPCCLVGKTPYQSVNPPAIWLYIVSPTWHKIR